MIRKKRLTAKQRDLRRYKVKARLSIGPLRSTVNRQAEKAEKAVIKTVRAACVLRDGYCRAQKFADTSWSAPLVVGPCSGPSEWAHLLTRAQTRNMAPEVRHQTAWSMMLCRQHHHDLDAHKINVECLGDRGADGEVVFVCPETLLLTS